MDEDGYIETIQGVKLPKIPYHGPRADQLRLVLAVKNNFGPCECVVHRDIFGNRCEGHPCGGHQFLCEIDEPGRTLEWTVPEVPEISFERGGETVNMAERKFTHFMSGSLHNAVTRLDRLDFARSRLLHWMDQEGFRRCMRCGNVTFDGDRRHACSRPILLPFVGKFEGRMARFNPNTGELTVGGEGEVLPW